jgi:hypothetical protein
MARERDMVMRPRERWPHRLGNIMFAHQHSRLHLVNSLEQELVLLLPLPLFQMVMLRDL